MAALDRLFDDEVARPTGRARVAPAGSAPSRDARHHDERDSVATHLLLPLPDVPRLEQAPARFLMTSERDGGCWDEHESWLRDRDRSDALYGRVEDVRPGWSKEIA